MGVLRTHTASSAEVVLSGTALLVSVAGVVLAATRVAVADWGSVIVSGAEAVALFGVVLWVLRRAGAPHVRKLTAMAWLAAYEDGLKEQAQQVRRPRWRWRPVR